MAEHDSLKALLMRFEGSILHMYLDSVGFVTVAVGHMIASVERAQELQFVVRATGEPASVEQIAADFQNVSAQPPNQLASKYKPFTSLEMTPAQIDALLDADIAAKEDEVRAQFANFETFPAPAKDGILDMAFNLGTAGLVRQFRRFKAAAERLDWATCALECRRNGIQESRNIATRELFERAAAGE